MRSVEATCVGVPPRHMGLEPDAINRDGGAIALSHPLGATGARIVGHLACVLAGAGPARLGIAAPCIGAGMGMAMRLERAG
jgi:acetyl-CoA acyltransferase